MLSAKLIHDPNVNPVEAAVHALEVRNVKMEQCVLQRNVEQSFIKVLVHHTSHITKHLRTECALDVVRPLFLRVRLQLFVRRQAVHQQAHLRGGKYTTASIGLQRTRVVIFRFKATATGTSSDISKRATRFVIPRPSVFYGALSITNSHCLVT